MKINSNLTDIYKKDTIEKSIVEQNMIRWYDSYCVYPIYRYFTFDDIKYIHQLAISPSLNCNVKEKYRLIGELMTYRGFRLIGGGTNRRAYECIYDDRVIAKVAIDQDGFTSNLKEFTNQNVLKPFCSKIFEVTPCGTLALVEKVVPIKDVSEYVKYSSDIFDMFYFKIRNNSIAMEDIGTRSFKNWGYRNCFGPVLLDYPTMYVADPSKRLCRNIVNNRMCGGTLDYDEGLNVIVCSECGRTHIAKTIAKKQGSAAYELLKAVGYVKENDDNKGVKAMKIKILNSKGEVESVKNITSSKSCCVDPTSSVVVKTPNYNRKPEPKFKRKRMGHIISCSNNTTATTEDIQQQPIVTKKEVESVIEITNDDKNIKTNKSLDNIIKEYERQLSIISSNTVSSSSTTLVKDDIIARLKDSFNNNNWKMDEFEAANLYRSISTATMIGDCYIDNSNISKADTMVNRLLKNIVPEIMYSDNDLSRVFMMLINTVRNTKDFFQCIISLWNTMLETMTFDGNIDSEGNKTYCIYQQIYDIYEQCITNAFETYLLSISFNSNLIYDKAAIRNNLIYHITKMNELNMDDEMDLIDTNRYVTINLYRDHCEVTSVSINENKEEPEQVPEENVIETSNISYSKTYDDDNYNRPMSKKQRDRYGKKKNKKRRR